MHRASQASNRACIINRGVTWLPLRSHAETTRWLRPQRPAIPLSRLHWELDQLWQAYQAGRFGYVTTLRPRTLTELHRLVDTHPADSPSAQRLLALAYQLASDQLTKLRETDLALLAADRRLHLARGGDDPALTASLLRTAAHSLLSTGRHREAVDLTDHTASLVQPHLRHAGPDLLAVYGTVFLTGSMAAARNHDPATAATFLSHADRVAQRLGHDTNHLWTAFGPTNVAIHRVATAAELGRLQLAADLSPQVDTTPLPTERRVRHALELARALSGFNRTDDAIATVLDAEQAAPEQVRC